MLALERTFQVPLLSSPLPSPPFPSPPLPSPAFPSPPLLSSLLSSVFFSQSPPYKHEEEAQISDFFRVTVLADSTSATEVDIKAMFLGLVYILKLSARLKIFIDTF